MSALLARRPLDPHSSRVSRQSRGRRRGLWRPWTQSATPLSLLFCFHRDRGAARTCMQASSYNRGRRPGHQPQATPPRVWPGQTSVSHKMHHGQNGESSPYPREWWPHPKSQCAFLYNCTLRALELYTLSCALMGLPRTMRGMMSGSMCTQMARISTKKAAAMCMQNWPDRTPLPSPNVATT